ncbi:MAG: hypothetical protein WD826_03585 [Actinomycetota bacterium]
MTNIELYEALKRDLSEDSARMIAEVIPKAEDLATRADIEAIRADIEATKADIAATRADIDRLAVATKADLLALEQRLDRRIMSLERRMYALVLVPMWGTMLGVLGVVLAKF